MNAVKRWMFIACLTGVCAVLSGCVTPKQQFKVKYEEGGAFDEAYYYYTDRNGEEVKHGFYHGYPFPYKTYGYYVDGKEEGIWRAFDISGKTVIETTIEGGVAHGPACVRYANGPIIENGLMINNEKHGLWYENHLNSTPRYLRFEHGKLIEEIPIEE